jgi:hypothetical protein
MFLLDWLYKFLYGKDQYDAVNSRKPPKVRRRK